MKDKFPAGYSSPLRLLAITIVGIVVAEIAAMVVVYSLGPLPYYQITLIDAAIMATLIFPALYFLSFRPLILHIDRRRQAEENLRKARNELELRVQERTEELKAANRDLLRYITERKQAEAALRGRSEEYDRLASATPEEWDRLLHDLRVHQIELEMQNEELRRTQAELELARDRYVDLYDFAPVGYLTLQPPGIIVEANLTVTQMLGVPRSQLVKNALGRFVASEDQGAYYQHLIALFKDEARDTFEVRLVKKDGTQFEARLEAAQSQAERVRLAISDVTERKRAERAIQELNATLEQRVSQRTAELRESQQRYSTVFDKSPFALALTRMPEGAIVGVNDAFLSLFECKRDEVLGKTSVELGVADPDSRAQVAAELQACGSVQGFEVLRTTKANTRLVLSLDLDWVSIGGENHILTTIHDITKRKQAESALRESEEKYRTLFNSMTEGFALHEIICDEAGAPCDYRFLEINPSFERLTGLHREAVIGKTVKEILPGVEAFWIETYGRVALSGEPAHFDRHSVILDRHYEVYAYCPTPGQFAVLFMDITERKRAEQELIEAQRRLGRERDILQTVMNGAKRSHLVYLDCGFNFVRVNQAYADTCGYQPEEMIGRNHFALYPQEENEAIFARVRDTGEPVEFHDKPFEFPDQPERGVTYWDWTLAPVKDEAGEVEGLVFSLFETTERKQMEQALRKAHDELELRVQERTKELADANRVLSNEITEHKRTEQALELERAKLRNIMDTMPDGIYIVNRQHDIEYVNPVIEREFGLVEGRKCYSYFHERAEACPWCKNEEVFSGKSIRWEWHSHKTQKTYDLFDTPMLNSDGGISKLELFHDITDRKQAEAELEQRNLELQVLSENEHKQRQLAETLRASAQALAQTLDLDIVLRTLLKHVRALVQSDTASVILLEGESLLSVRAVEGYERWTDPNQILSFKVDGANNPFYQKLIATRKSLLIPDTASEPGWEVFPGTEPIRNCIFAPILIEGKIIGVVGLSKAEPNYFTAEHAQWAEALVGQAAVAIQNAWLFEQVRAGRERLQSLSRRLVDIQESERRFVARELHDHAAQNLTSLILGLGAIEKEASQLPKIRARASELKTMTDGVLEDLHRLAINLRPASLDHLGLVPALEQLIKSFTQNSSLQIRFKAAGIGEDDRLPQEVETTLYRITQEALTNVVRHASAQRADVVLERRGDTALVLIEDDGKGFDLEKAKIGGHLGLLGMEERAEMLGGKLTVESVPGKGTIIVAEVPYADPNPARR